MLTTHCQDIAVPETVSSEHCVYSTDYDHGTLKYSELRCPFTTIYNTNNNIYVNQLRWLNTVFQKMKNSRFRLVFLDCYFLMSNKEYRTDVKQRPKGSNLFTEATQLSFLWQR